MVKSFILQIMKTLYLTPELLKKTYTYKQTKHKLAITIAFFIFFFFFFGLITLILLVDPSTSHDVGPVIFLDSVILMVFFGLFAYYGNSLSTMKKCPENYTLYKADVSDYEIESRSRGKYGSQLYVILNLSFECNDRVIERRVDVPLHGSLKKTSAINNMKFMIAYDDKTDRFIVCDDIADKLGELDLFEESTPFDWFE